MSAYLKAEASRLREIAIRQSCERITSAPTRAEKIQCWERMRELIWQREEQPKK